MASLSGGDVTFRPAVPNDYDAIAAIATIAYPWGGEDAASLAERYRATHPGPPKGRSAKKSAAGARDARAVREQGRAAREQGRAARERWVVERGGALVAVYTDLALDFWVGGRAAAARGLSGVTVAPEARKSGVASAILAHHAARAREHGAAWSLCYAYAPDFYARHGWASVGRRVRWRGSPAELPLYSERSLVQRLDVSAPGAAERIAESYARYCAATNGSVARPGPWRSAGGDPAFVVAVASSAGPLRAHAAVSYRATRARQTLVVPELVTHDGEARRALLGFFAAQRDQADAIEIDSPEGDAVGAVFARRASRQVDADDPEDHRPVATLYDGLLARTVDLASALVQRGYAKGSRARIAIRADDALLPANALPFVATIDRGRARVTSRVAREPLLRGSVDALTRVVTGAVRLRDAIDYGLVRMDRASAPLVDALDTAFALSSPAPLLAF